MSNQIAIRLRHYCTAFAGFFCLTLLVACGSPDPQEELAAIRKCYQRYHSAIAARDDKIAAYLVDQETVSFYASIRKYALSAPSAKVKSLGPAEQILVLGLRQSLTLTELDKMNGHSLLRYFVKQGWTGNSTGGKGNLGKITWSDDTAVATLEIQGKPVPLRWHFTKEDDVWKINLAIMIPIANQMLTKLINRRSMSVEDFVLKVTGSRSGKAVSHKIWEPLANWAH